MSKLSINQGDTFSKLAFYRDAKKKLIDLSDIEFTAWIETPDKVFHYDLTATKLDQTTNKGAVIFAAENTSTWPVGAMNLFVQQTVAGATETMSARFAVTEL